MSILNTLSIFLFSYKQLDLVECWVAYTFAREYFEKYFETITFKHIITDHMIHMHKLHQCHYHGPHGTVFSRFTLILFLQDQSSDADHC